MRILYDFQVFQIQEYGGISRYVAEIATRIAAFEGVKVTVFRGLHRSRADWSTKNEALSGNYGIWVGSCVAGWKPTSLVNYALFSLFQTTRKRFDILHLTYYPREIINRKGAKLVVSLYDMIPETFPALYLGDPIIERRKLAFQAADIILSISEASKKDLLRIYPVDPAKVKVVHLAGSLLSGRDSVERTSGLSGLPRPRPSILYVGGRAAYKNFAAVLSAFGSDPELHDNFDLCCFGSIPFSPEEKRRIAELHLEQRVRHEAGSDALLRACYESASVLVYPSLCEGFGLPLLEAMDLCCPVVASDRGSIPEVLAGAGILFDPTRVEDIARALKMVLFDEETRRTCISKGRERVKAFSWQRTAELTMAAYSSCLA
jgi:glycosyltransferase involved in cell wall biosynthesis